MTNSADDIPQSERGRLMAEQRRLRTYRGHAQANLDEDRGGRFAFSGSPKTVTGSSPISYPAQPTHSPWHSNPYPEEPPLGFSVDAMEPVANHLNVTRLRQQRFRGREVRDDNRTNCQAQSGTNPQGEIAVEDM